MPTIKTNGIDTYYEAVGSGPPLVFVHGAFVDHRMWKPQVNRFAKGYRVVTYDLRGHGQTGPNAVRRYSIGLFADDLCALLDGLGIDQAAVCGLSLGGMVAQAFAASSPQRLYGLALCDTAVASVLTLGDRIQRLLFSEWLMGALLRAFDLKTGAVRWQTELPRSAIAMPITYQMADGK